MAQKEILNRLWFCGNEKVVNKMKNQIKGLDEADQTRQIHIDFNKIIPMPETLDIEDNQTAALATIFSTRTSEVGINNQIKSPMELNEKEFNLYLSYLKNMYNHKYINWFQWRMIKWNSAWNAYNTKEVGEAIQFTTRFSPSLNITLELSRQFKEIELIHGYIEKETESPGKVCFKDGTVKLGNFENNHEKSEFATNLLEDDK
jgi:hypothetical protein